jgi:hypothetical protein
MVIRRIIFIKIKIYLNDIKVIIRDNRRFSIVSSLIKEYDLKI